MIGVRVVELVGVYKRFSVYVAFQIAFRPGSLCKNAVVLAQINVIVLKLLKSLLLGNGYAIDE